MKNLEGQTSNTHVALQEIWDFQTMPALGQTVERILTEGSAQNSDDTALLVISNGTTLLVRGVGATESVADGKFDVGRRSVLAGESSPTRALTNYRIGDFAVLPFSGLGAYDSALLFHNA